MKITFVALGCEQLPVSLLAAIARREGHQVGLAFSASLFNDRFNFHLPRLASIFDDRDDVLRTIEEQKPDVLAFSALTNTYTWMLSVAREAKARAPHIKTVFGGVHPSAVPELVLTDDVVDYVCVGEGDIAFTELLRALDQGGPAGAIDNILYRGPDGAVVRGAQSGFIQDLDSLPFFDKELWEDHIRVGDFYMTMASRGCPYRCTFCFNNFFARLPDAKNGKYVRQRSVAHMLGELRDAKRRYRLRYVKFEDDIFTVNKPWLHDFLAAYKREIAVPFSCLVHPRYIDDDVARWLNEAGCQWVQMGIQSVNDEFKFKTLKRYEKTDSVSSAIDTLRKHRVKLKTDHIFGLPGDPPDAQEEARALYVAQTPQRIGTYWATYFPGTEMVEQGRALGLIDDNDIAAINSGDMGLFHANSDSAESERFRGYDLLFRMLPLLPRPLRAHVAPSLVARLPRVVTGAIGFAADLINGALTLSQDHIAYARHYSYWLRRMALRSVGLPTRPATVIRDTTR